jgi:uncharacterized protein (DUF302 family)
MHRSRYAVAVAVAVALALAVSASTALSQSVAPREGWSVTPTGMPYQDLLAALREAIEANKMGLVTEAGPTELAATRGETIPGNRVVGVFRNDFAVTAVRASTAAMIEAPIRFYVTENEDGTATLSYKTPSFVFAPYIDEGGEALATVAEELDAIFAQIAADATAPQ